MAANVAANLGATNLGATTLDAINWGSLIITGVNPWGRKLVVVLMGVFEVNYEGTVCAAKEIHTLLLQYWLIQNLYNYLAHICFT